MTDALAAFDRERQRARDARQEARKLRELPKSIHNRKDGSHDHG
jgi:hypothetical protein